MTAWLSAYLFTVAFEMPLWAWGLRRTLPDGRLLVALSFSTSLFTHPVLWLTYTPTSEVGAPLLLAESVVILVEAILVWTLWNRAASPASKRASWWRCLAVSLAANSLSAGLGLLLF
ncbi:MAG: hypothetical protein ACI8QS_000668 [Planctomycetota bacterium]|jgi:hypothetical protein